MKKRSNPRLLLLAGLAVLATSASAQSQSVAYLLGKGPNGLVDSYAGVLTVGRTFQPSVSSIFGKYLPKLSFQLDGFAGTGTTYKENIGTVNGLAKYAISPTFAGYLGIWQSGDINAFSFSQLDLKHVSLFVGVGGMWK